MPFHSITRLRLRSVLVLPRFAQATRAISEQMSPAPGFLGGAVLAEGWMVFWTRSAWESLEAMTAFRDSGAHRDVMGKLLDWCDEAAVAHWDGEAAASWEDIHTRMVAEGRSSRVRRPTKAHTLRQIAPLRRWSREQPIIPHRALSS